MNIIDLAKQAGLHIATDVNWGDDGWMYQIGTVEDVAAAITARGTT